MGTGLISHLIAASTADAGLIVASAIEVAFDQDGAPARRVKLLPMGEIRLRDGRGPYQLRDRAHAEQVVAATRSYLGSVDFMFDYDHQVLSAQPGKGGTAPASGWVKVDQIEADDEGIWATVDWTSAADAALRKREYRYISPVFRVDPTGEVARLSNAALTNTPAIDMPAIAASVSGDSMSLTKIAAALGLAASAGEDAILAAIDAKKTPATSTIAIAAGLAADASAEDIAAAVTTLRTDMVPKSIADDLKAEVQRIRDKRLGDEVDRLVAAGIVMPAKREDTLAWFQKDEVAASAFFKDMPAIITPGQRPSGDQQRQNSAALDADEIAACAALGISEADFIKARDEEIA